MLTDFRLKVFYTVLQYRNFTRAARALGISQPAVSQNIAELEGQVGDTLLQRGPTGVKPTQKGEILFQYAEKILHLYENLNTELIPSGGVITTHLRIAASPMAVRYILPKAIDKFTALNPRIEVSLLEKGDGEIEDAVLDGFADLGVMESIPGRVESTPYMEMKLSESGESVLKLHLAYLPDGPNKEAVQRFVLTSKTTR